ncbi:hypothetical protein [Nocardia sp. NPDC052566]|uniref:hypothetical protein n=1 Tax=Nocardia sp. NPDC052566 TaxID=3364330 RepID=UPI0037CB9492
MRFRSTTAAALLAVGAMTVASATVHAEPAADPGLRYSLKVVDKTVVVSLAGGVFSLDEREGATPEAPKVQYASVKDTTGATLVSFPLDYRAGGAPVPLRAVATKGDTVLEITPEQSGVSRLGEVKPIASPLEDQRAQDEFSSKLGMATKIGGFVGSAIGFVIGCVVGLLVGCIPGGIIGGLIGTIVAGGPTLIVAGMELMETQQAPPGTTKWADHPQPAPQN